MNLYIPHSDQTILGQLARKAFPKNRKDICVKPFAGPMNVNSYWDGGSKDEYRLVDLATEQVYSVPTSHPFFDRKSNGERCGNLELGELPPNTCLISGGVFCGKPATVTIHLRQDNIADLLPAPIELSEQERRALEIVRSYRGGYRSEEFERCDLGHYSAYNPHITGLADKQLLKVNKAGAISITTAGKNAV